MGALLVYCNSEIVSENGPTDEACYWNRRSKIRYKGGREMEELLNLKPEDKCPVVTFDPPTEEQRLKQLEVMEEAGNTNCPLYKLFQMKFEPPRAPTEEVMLPKWVETNVFKPTPFEIPFEPSTDLEERMRIFFEEHVEMTPKLAYRLCSLTVEQAASLLWRKHRKLLITSTGVIFLLLLC